MKTWALVPVVATPEMLRQTRAGKPSYDYMLTASPGADLLERIVRARNDLAAVRASRGSEWCDYADAMSDLMVLLDELGGSNG
jgi:hypothetical protein